MLAPWKKSYTNLESILKSRDISLPTKVHPSSQSCFFSSSHVWMWELDYKESWVLRIDAVELWYWRRLLRVPWTARRSNQLTLKEINPEYSLEAWCWNSSTWPHDGKNCLIGKNPDSGEDWKQETEWQENKMVGWHHWLIGHESASSGSWWWTGKPVML